MLCEAKRIERTSAMPFTVSGNGSDGGAVPSDPLSADGITAHHAFAYDAGCRPMGRSQAGQAL